MLEKMGSQHSSFSCGQLAYSFHNCFGMGSESSRNSSKGAFTTPMSNASDLSVDEEQEMQVRRSTSRSHRLSCTETCCAQNCKNSEEQFPYDLCDVSQNQGQENCSKEKPNGVPSRRVYCVCKKSSLKCSCTKYQDNVIPPKGSSASNIITCLSAEGTVESSNNNKLLKDTTTERTGQKEKLLSSDNISDVTKSNYNCDHNPLHLNTTIGFQAVDNATTDTAYFRKLITDEELKLTDLVKAWNSIIANGSQCPSEVCDEIRSVVGQTRLIIDERFSQFSMLIDRADGKTDSDRPVLVSDLQGFWDMIYFQVEDVVKKFKNLQTLKESNWKVNDSLNCPSTSTKKVTKQSSRPKKSKTQSKSKEEDKKRREAARKRLAEARKALASRAQTDSPADQLSLDNAVTPQPEQLAHEQSVSLASDSLISEPLSLSSKFDAVSCSLSAVPANQDSNITNTASTSTSLVH
uniref:Uncharacterized protein LOC100176117 n=1 Tax=Phallusia mammillata TaxID=59560 RepID=A0A6F9DGX7_9ASCI|nr:uncharacterized protein LOC100176117 [Phallusia mammillata]